MGLSFPRTPGGGLSPTSFVRHGPSLVRAQRRPDPSRAVSLSM